MNKETKKKESILRNNAVQTILASLLCIVVGLLIGYAVLLIINPKGASGAIVSILKNYLYYPSSVAVMKYCGTTLVKASALLFGLFRALSNVYTGFDVLVALKLPSTLYNMFPYIISLIVLVFVSKNSRAPKAEGIPYDKGQR